MGSDAGDGSDAGNGSEAGAGASAATGTAADRSLAGFAVDPPPSQAASDSDARARGKASRRIDGCYPIAADNKLTPAVTRPSATLCQNDPVATVVILQKDRTMKRKLPLILLAATGIVATSAAVAARPAPAEARGQAYWSETYWDDDDDDDRRRRGPMPVPNAEVLKRAGMVRVVEVERDDGRIEVEGYDAAGRELEIRMDARGQRILSIDRDDDRDD